MFWSWAELQRNSHNCAKTNILSLTTSLDLGPLHGCCVIGYGLIWFCFHGFKGALCHPKVETSRHCLDYRFPFKYPCKNTCLGLLVCFRPEIAQCLVRCTCKLNTCYYITPMLSTALGTSEKPLQCRTELSLWRNNSVYVLDWHDLNREYLPKCH